MALVCHTMWQQWLLFLLEITLSCVTSFKQREGEGEREVLMRQMSLARLAAGWLLGLLLLLLCLKLDGVMDSWVWILLPLFVGSGLYFCCCSCLCCTLWLAPKPNARDVPAGSEPPTPLATDRDPLLAAERRGGGGGGGYGGTRSPTTDEEV